MVTDFLRSRWHRTLSTLPEPLPVHRRGMADLLIDQILQSYSEPHRHYHTGEHLMACFQVLDRLFPRTQPDPPPSSFTVLTKQEHSNIELALWFHDIVYDTHRDDNEGMSGDQAADIILNGLDLSNQTAIDVVDLIGTTRLAVVPVSVSAKVLQDVDLSILGETKDAYDRYEERIREEYFWVTEAGFKEGRRKVLQGFLDREWIYSCPEMRRAGYEGRAQDNLRRALKNLG